MTENCTRMSQVALDELVRDPESRDWEDLRAHAVNCPSCSAEMTDWLRMGTVLRGMRDEAETIHPSEDDLLRFHLHRELLSEVERGEIESHLERCRSCTEELSAADTFDFSLIDRSNEPSPGVAKAHRVGSSGAIRSGVWRAVTRVVLHPAFAYAIALVACASAIRQAYFPPSSDSVAGPSRSLFGTSLRHTAPDATAFRPERMPSSPENAAAHRVPDGYEPNPDGRGSIADESETSHGRADPRLAGPPPEAGSSSRAPLDTDTHDNPIRAVGDSQSARPIFDSLRALEEGDRWWDDQYRRLSVVVAEPAIPARNLGLDLYERRGKDSRRKTLTVFWRPAEKAGIALLSDRQSGRPGTQWLFTPENRRIRQIAESTRDVRFDTTDFTYRDLDVLADMPFWSEADASAVLRGVETLDGVTCLVIELTAQTGYLGYSRIIVWLGDKDLVLRQAEFYEPDRPAWFEDFLGRVGPRSAGGAPVRRLRQWDVRWSEGIPTPHAIEFQTLPEGSTTKIEVIEVLHNQGFPDSMFSPANLAQQSNR